MIVIRNLSDLKGAISPSAVTIGNFDGVHLGHQKLIQTVVHRAKADRLLSVVVTFDPHPLRVLTGKKHPPFITLTKQKLQLISSLGPEVTYLLPFSREVAAMEPEDFVRQYLLEGLDMKLLVIGYDYAFGKGRKGNYELLKEMGGTHGFEVDRLDPVLVGDAVVSSTRIRDLVQAGKVWEARPLLGRFYQVYGAVIHGHDRGGKLLGFPTANLVLEDELTPKPGVYAVWAECEHVSDCVRPAVANVGYNPTFGETALSVEVHVLDFDGNLYDRPIRVHFVQRIRSERKFANIEELKARIAEDVTIGRRILSAPEAKI